MSSGVEIKGTLGLSQRTVLAILDREAQLSVRQAETMRAKALNAAAPVGRTSGQRRTANPSGTPLSKSHRPSVRKTGRGWQGRVRRNTDAWYGRIVERGRPAGRSETGRGYPAAPANPFVDHTDAAVAGEAERILEQGAARAAAKIDQRL